MWGERRKSEIGAGNKERESAEKRAGKATAGELIWGDNTGSVEEPRGCARGEGESSTEGSGALKVLYLMVSYVSPGCWRERGLQHAALGAPDSLCPLGCVSEHRDAPLKSCPGRLSAGRRH